MVVVVFLVWWVGGFGLVGGETKMRDLFFLSFFLV